MGVRFAHPYGKQLKAVICLIIIAAIVMSNFPTLAVHGVSYDADCRKFDETGKTVCGRFLEYWNRNGELAQQGLPISEVLEEKSEIDGKVYTVQYFERAVFELHPENAAPYDVLLSLLGTLEYKKRWGGIYKPIQKANIDTSSLVFSQTGKSLGGPFRAYWERNGGLAQQGYPITNEFQERNPVDDEIYTVQYFERAVFELHPENDPPYDVLLSHLGRFQYDRKYNVLPKPGPAPNMDEQACRKLRARSGTAIAQGSNDTPVGGLKIKTYRVEEIVLPRPVTCTVDVPRREGGLQGETLLFDKFWKLIVTVEEGHVIPEGSLSWFLWLDDKPVAHTSPSKGRFVGVIYDWKLLREGATIGIGYGTLFEPPPSYNRLPEKLHLNTE